MADPVQPEAALAAAMREAAAATMVAVEGECHGLAIEREQGAAIASYVIAAFLRALPVRFNTPLTNPDGSEWGETAWAADWAVLAAAVEKEASDAG